MGKATGFQFNTETGDISMNSGDTGSFWVHAALRGGGEWTSDSRMLFTVKNAEGEIVMQRIYRLDDQWGQGDGWVLIEFHNDDTDGWGTGQYSVELRFVVNPRWDGTAPTGRCVNALTAGVKMIEGDVVRTEIHSSLTIDDIYGEV